MAQQTFKVVLREKEDGSGIDMGFFAADGTYEQGVDNLNKILAALQANGVDLANVSQVENHRAGGDRVLDRLHDTSHEHGHHHH